MKHFIGINQHVSFKGKGDNLDNELALIFKFVYLDINIKKKKRVLQNNFSFLLRYLLSRNLPDCSMQKRQNASLI